MEFFTILLSSLLGLVSPVGFVVDRVAESSIRSQFKKVEQLQVRVDNAPSYQLLQGKVERVRIAGRGLRLKKLDIRIAALELETDPIELEPRSLRRPKLEQPLQTGLRLVLTEQDINKALQSRRVVSRLRKLSISLLGDANDDVRRYNFANPRVEFLENNRVRLQVELQEKGNADPLIIEAESGLRVVAGRQLQLVKLVASVNNEAVPEQIINEIATNLSQQLDLRNLEGAGITGRILQFKIEQQQLQIAAFVRVEKSSPFLDNRRSSL